MISAWRSLRFHGNAQRAGDLAKAAGPIGLLGAVRRAENLLKASVSRAEPGILFVKGVFEMTTWLEVLAQIAQAQISAPAREVLSSSVKTTVLGTLKPANLSASTA